MNNNIRLYNKDCLEGLKDLEASGQKVDLILTDPPYLMRYKTNHRKEEHRFDKEILNDNNPEIIKDFIKLSAEVLKEGGAFYCFCSYHHIDYFKTEINKHFKFKNIITWYKNNGTAGDLYGNYANWSEFIIYATKGRHLLNPPRPRNVLEFKRVPPSKLLHQNQKPTDLLEYLINKSTKEGDTVLDCFAGSGSTAEACNNTGRAFIGFELDKYYYDVAKNRLSSFQTKIM